MSTEPSFPNYKTFYFWRQHTTEPWVLLGLDAAILWELDCAFCKANAASNEVTSVPITTRRQVYALEDMFGNVRERGLVIDRGQLGLPLNYPTHPQAEVLVFGPIPPRLIRHIWFEGYEQLYDYQVRATTHAWYSKMRVNEEYFRPRMDYRFWQRHS